jgi:hypothetical protein
MKDNNCKLEGVKYTPLLLDEIGQFPHHYRKAFDEIKISWKTTPVNSLGYLDTLPKAYKIYSLLLGEPKTHREWADRFNKVGEINKILMKNPQE